MPPASLQTQMGLEHLAAIPPDVSAVACFVSLLLPSAQLLLTPLTPSVSTSPEGQGVGRFRAVRKSAGQKGGLAAEVSCGGPYGEASGAWGAAEGTGEPEGPGP